MVWIMRSVRFWNSCLEKKLLILRGIFAFLFLKSCGFLSSQRLSHFQPDALCQEMSLPSQSPLSHGHFPDESLPGGPIKLFCSCAQMTHSPDSQGCHEPDHWICVMLLFTSCTALAFLGGAQLNVNLLTRRNYYFVLASQVPLLTGSK